MIASDVNRPKHWQFLLDQIKNPGHGRVVHKLNAGADRTKILDPRTGDRGKFKTRKVNKQRGRNKWTKYVKKTSLSLAPQDGVMRPFTTQYGTGLIFNIKKCKIKKKYIFLGDAWTDKRWWIKNNDPTKNYSKSVALKLLRKHNKDARKKNQTPRHNEILGCPSKAAVSGIYCPVDNATGRLNALYRKYLVKAQLNRTAPIMIMTKNTPAREYTGYQQLLDLYAGKYAPTHIKQTALINKMPYGLTTTVSHICKTYPITKPQMQKLLSIAVKDNSEEFALALLKKPINPNENYLSARRFALHHAVINGNKELVKRLCQRGARAGLEDDLKRTPLSMALFNGFYEITNIILDEAYHTLNIKQIVATLKWTLEKGKYDLAEKIMGKLNKDVAKNLSYQGAVDHVIFKYYIILSIVKYKKRLRPKKWNNNARQNQINQVYHDMKATNQESTLQANLQHSEISIRQSHAQCGFWGKHKVTQSHLAKKLQMAQRQYNTRIRV